MTKVVLSRWDASPGSPKVMERRGRLACGDIKEQPFAFRWDSDVLPVIIKA